MRSREEATVVAKKEIYVEPQTPCFFKNEKHLFYVLKIEARLLKTLTFIFAKKYPETSLTFVPNVSTLDTMRAFYVVFILSFFCFLPFKLTQAQDVSFGVATYVPIEGKNIENGSIVSTSNQGFILSTRPYDPLVFGIVSTNPAVSFGSQTDAEKHPVISSGQAFVLVNGENGPIKNGDLITTSSTPGVGMKAVKSGFVVGSVLADFTPRDKADQKLIPLSMNLHFFTTKSSIPAKLSDIFNFSLLAASDEPLTVFKYIVALFIIVLSFILGLFSFGKIATNGIEALGRNPLAARMIEIGIIFNVVVTIAIIAAGIIMALFVIRL